MNKICYIITGLTLLLNAIWGGAYLFNVFEDGSPFELATMYTVIILGGFGFVLVFRGLWGNE